MNLSDMVAGRKQAPEDNGPLVKRADFNSPLTERTGFMNMRKLQPIESLTGAVRSMSAASIILFKVSWACCRNAAASGL